MSYAGCIRLTGYSVESVNEAFYPESSNVLTAYAER